MHIAKLMLVCGGATAAGVTATALRPVLEPPPLVMTVADETAPRPWLGVTVRDTPAALAAQLGIDRGDATLIASVVEGSPAAKAGLEQYDLVLGAGDARVPLAEALRRSAPGDRITLHILRAGDERTITVTLGERPAGDAAAPEAPRARVDLEDDDAWSFGLGADDEAARRAAEEAMRQARRAMEQARQTLEQQEWAEGLDFGDMHLPEMEFGEFDFETGFDHEAFAKQMEAFAERHEQQMAQIETMIKQRLEPAMKALEVYLDKLMAVISKEADAALGAPLEDRLADALDDADIDATAKQIEDAVRRFIESAGFSVDDAEMEISASAERIERSLTKALENAGVDVADIGGALDDIAAWLDEWTAQMSEEGAEAMEKLKAEFEKYQKQLEDLAPEAPEPPPAPEPTLAEPASGGKA